MEHRRTLAKPPGAHAGAVRDCWCAKRQLWWRKHSAGGPHMVFNEERVFVLADLVNLLFFEDSTLVGHLGRNRCGFFYIVHLHGLVDHYAD